ncbi:hypothetical protein IFT47_04370 [Pseudomonas sp. CFBP 13711]|uniref:DUF5677 domain-containing protein n=1 Tax=unclassified Pseudomonas TaxID=196821 RepID=UPI00177CC283|nr:MULTISPECIES: DUF5677 domain-containing protein [unclassified Pseudomonas]MBD8705864.1 hypothetical protein [Pseudomonas sp. CFBP 13711]MBD8710437.1 hypothetical protein [Pseudomonas sp. CFBP 13715]
MTNSTFEGPVFEDVMRKIRSESAIWFSLAEDVNVALRRLVDLAENQIKGTSMDPLVVGVRILMRTAGMYQGALLLTERGMTSEARTLTRSVLEGAFAVAALLKNPGPLIEVLKDDLEKSRIQQARFIKDQNLVADKETIAKLIKVIEKPGKFEFMSPKGLAGKGVLLKQYLVYQRLSEDSAHISLKSLNRHVQKVGEGWRYRMEPGSAAENEPTLYHAISAVLALSIGMTELLDFSDLNQEFAVLSDRFAKMPVVAVV